MERRITDELSKNAEQWIPDEATLERLPGDILIGDQTISLPLIFVWNSLQASPFNKSSWGGSARLIGEDVLSILMTQLKECKVVVRDGRMGTALIRQFSMDFILFIGSGTFSIAPTE